MPTPGTIWWHLILNTKGSWLHGDDRGFRSRDHRIHSSGDYKHRPPRGEHAGLHRYHQQRSSGEVLIPPHLYAVVGERIIRKAQAENHRLIVLSAGITHVHGLVELPDDYALAKQVRVHGSRPHRTRCGWSCRGACGPRVVYRMTCGRRGTLGVYIRTSSNTRRRRGRGCGNSTRRWGWDSGSPNDPGLRGLSPRR